MNRLLLFFFLLAGIAGAQDKPFQLQAEVGVTLPRHDGPEAGHTMSLLAEYRVMNLGRVEISLGLGVRSLEYSGATVGTAIGQDISSVDYTYDIQRTDINLALGFHHRLGIGFRYGLRLLPRWQSDGQLSLTQEIYYADGTEVTRDLYFDLEDYVISLAGEETTRAWGSGDGLGLDFAAFINQNISNRFFLGMSLRATPFGRQTYYVEVPPLRCTINNGCRSPDGKANELPGPVLALGVVAGLRL